MKVFSKIILGVTIGWFLFSFLFFWLNANIDSYFYYAIGEYFRTGNYPFQAPFIYTKPTTISPPLYGLFFTFTHGISRADILLHGMQLLFLALTSLLLYKLLCLRLSHNVSMIVSCLFALYPTNIIYAGTVMTENPSQFVVVLITYLIVTKRAPMATLVASIGTVLKYNLAIYVLFASVFTRTKKDALLVLCAFVVLMGWVYINHEITGVWGLYDTRGTQLYNQFVAPTKLLPPKNHPSVIRMRSLLPPGTDIAVPYWDLQEKLGNALGHEWTAIDNVLFDVGWASVTTHPVEYVLHSIKNYALLHYDHVPHWSNIGNIGLTGLTGNNKPFCSNLGSVTTCTPILMTPWSYPLWNAFVHIEMRLFEIFAAPVFYLVLLPALIVSLIAGKASRLYALLYLSGTIPIAFTIHPDPRYIVPFYPLIVIIISHAVHWIITVYAARHRSHR